MTPQNTVLNVELEDDASEISFTANNSAHNSDGQQGSNDIQNVTTKTFDADDLAALGLNLHRIDKDVARCDRNHTYFAERYNLEVAPNHVQLCLGEFRRRLCTGHV